MIYIASQTNYFLFAGVIFSSIYKNSVVTVDLLWEEDIFFFPFWMFVLLYLQFPVLVHWTCN